MGFDAEKIIPPGAKIKVIGIGGGGGNAVNTMIRSNLEGVDFVAANTDVQALRFALPDYKIQLGKELTKGLGAGADPDVGRDAALEDRHEIQEAIGGADMVFITAGMGGGTGTGGASVVAQIAREMGALTVAVVTKPFNFEGKRRRKHAELGIERLRENVDTLITIPNQRLLQIATPDLSMVDAFRMADEVLVNAVKGISDIINVPGTVNVDFADVKTVMSSMGLALMGIGRATGETRAVEAARQAIRSPLLEDVDIEGATGILINITAGSNISLMEVNEACSIIQDAAHEDANIIFGAVIDENCGDEIRVTVIATGFPADYEETDDIPANRYFGSRRDDSFSGKMPVQRKIMARPRPQESKINFDRAMISKPVVRDEPQIEPADDFAAEDLAKMTFAPQEEHIERPVHVESRDVAEEPESAFESRQESTSAQPTEEATREAASDRDDHGWEEQDERHAIAQQNPVHRQAAQAADIGDEADTEESHSELDQSEPARDAQNLRTTEQEQRTVQSSQENVATALVPVTHEPDVETTDTEESNEPTVRAAEFAEFDLDPVIDVADDVEDDDDNEYERLGPPPMEPYFSDAKQNFERKIDEALELAERLRGDEEDKPSEEDDDLDIPAFLRDGRKDLSLD